MMIGSKRNSTHLYTNLLSSLASWSNEQSNSIKFMSKFTTLRVWRSVATDCGQRIGKPTGVDIKERKITLPLIHTLQQCPASERRRLIRLVKYRHNDSRAVKEVMNAVINGPGMQYARDEMNRLRDEALSMLDAFPDTASRRSLADLVRFTIDRKK